ncbi:MAG: iron-sulfur cluster assembly scaffold protein [Lysobacterales bacterium]
MSAAPQDRLVRLYQEAIRRHAAEPTGFRQAIEPTHRHEAWNPQCGDRVEILLRLSGETIEAAAFEGEACAICLASASILCGIAPGQPAVRLQQLHDALSDALRAEETTDGDDLRLQPELRPLLGVRPYPSRIRCATLPWIAASNALTD